LEELESRVRAKKEAEQIIQKKHEFDFLKRKMDAQVEWYD